MRILRLFLIFALSVTLLHDVCFAAEGAAALLPRAFGSWRLAKSSQPDSDPLAADAANAAVLKEYGFTDVTAATYSRDDGRHLTVKAARFQDASGAFGAYTFYRAAEMHSEEIGDQGSSLGSRVLFFRGKILVDASFERLSAMSAAELRELAESLPKASGTEAKLPDLSAYLPKQTYVENSAKYVLGPLALEKDGAPLVTQLVDFTKGAEVVLGDYRVSGSAGRLMLIAYPTSQIATGEFARIDAAEKANQLREKPLAKRRTGRIIALMAGNISADAARDLLSAVDYDADVTWNQNTYQNPRDNIGALVLGVTLLAAIIVGLLIVTSLAFGGIRLAIKRLLPGKVFDRPEQVEIIGLHLSDSAPPGPETGVNSSIKAG